MDDQTHHAGYEFGEFHLDSRRGVLRMRQDGRPIELAPKALGVLVHLVERAGRTVSKGDLLHAVWPGLVVEEGNLTQAIHVLRKALGEHPEEHRYIVTVPGHGYRFVAEVRTPPSVGVATAAALPAAAVRRWLAFGVVILGVLAAGYVAFLLPRPGSNDDLAADLDNSIAVLPFTDLSPSRDSAWFADGLAEEVLDHLAATPGLRVIARTSSFSLANRNLDIPAIATRLKVGHVLEGSVRRLDGNVRVSVKLIDATDSSQAWSAVYERPLDDVLAVQTEIATAVAGALHAKTRGLATESGATPRHGGPAWEDFLRGRFYFSRRAPGDLERALAAYDQALTLDARFARAWAGRAAVLAIRIPEGSLSRESGLPLLLEAARKTLLHDPRSTEGHLRLMDYYLLIGEQAKAQQEFRTAASMEPRNELVLEREAAYAAVDERYADAVARQREVMAIDPLSATAAGKLGAYLLASGLPEEAKAAYLRALDLGGDPAHVADVGRILVLQGKGAEAMGFIEGAGAGSTRDRVIALAAFSAGRVRDSDLALARLVTEAGPTDPFALAEAYAWRGEPDAAFRWLARATTRPGWEMKSSPLLASLHRDPRWAAWAAAATEQPNQRLSRK
jgi:TolB-like protein/DNA-binding winged helix-turn-helix (wHTH) protein